jgi:hypothetical protein
MIDRINRIICSSVLSVENSSLGNCGEMLDYFLYELTVTFATYATLISTPVFFHYAS